MQVHTPLSHWAFGPHGDGLHGSDGVSVTGTNGQLYTFENNTAVEGIIGICFLLDGGGSGVQLVKGSPVYPSGQVQAGV